MNSGFDGRPPRLDAGETMARMAIKLTAGYMKVSESYVAFIEELPGANTQGLQRY